MISKELLSEVLEYKVDKVYTKDHLGNNYKRFIRFRLGDFVDEISIHELEYRCKERAFIKGFKISSQLTENGGHAHVIKRRHLHDEDWAIGMYGDTITEAVIKAYQWLLENK